MKLFRAYATMKTILVCEFELKDDASDEDALTYATYELDGGDFEEIEDCGDWDVYKVEEVK